MNDDAVFGTVRVGKQADHDDFKSSEKTLSANILQPFATDGVSNFLVAFKYPFCATSPRVFGAELDANYGKRAGNQQPPTRQPQGQRWGQ